MVVARIRTNHEYDSLAYYCGYVPELKHPMMTATGEPMCGICGGHADRRMHDLPHNKHPEFDSFVRLPPDVEPVICPLPSVESSGSGKLPL